MDQLKLLWQLQNCDKDVQVLNERLAEIKEGEDIQLLYLRLKEREYDSTNINTLIEVNNAKIERHNKKLERLNYELKEMEEKLYGGNVSDIEQLKFMDKESKEKKEEISKLETETLDLMSKIEELKKESVKVAEEEKNLNEQLEVAEVSQKEKIMEVEKIIEDKGKERQAIVEELDEETIEKYNDLKSSKGKGKAVVAVTDKRCTGCHMNVPLSILSKLKKNGKISYCDNCGRILYYEKKEEE